MSVLERLACAVGRRDEVVNQELAAHLVHSNHRQAVRELIDGLQHRDRSIQSDAIKVLYEMGMHDPKLIAHYLPTFVQLLQHTHNRLVWGAMIALDQITRVDPRGVFAQLDDIIRAARQGSVITRDHAMGILTQLGQRPAYMSRCLPLVIEQLKTCPDNQFPMYCEKALAMASDANRTRLQQVMQSRLAKVPKESQKKRVLKVLNQLTR